jgi:glucose-1-phosphate thymidylyltransferase
MPEKVLQGGKKMKKAIILNAGEGKRLRPLTENVHTCLVKVGNTTILEHQLSNIVGCGIREVILAVGYHHERINKELQKSQFDLEVTYVRNPIYYKTNNAEMIKDFADQHKIEVPVTHFVYSALKSTKPLIAFNSL